jgi:hypothetical protein
VAFIRPGKVSVAGGVRVNVLTTALAANGQMLAQPLEFTFKAVGFLEVTQVMPADEAEGIDPKSDITVMFNRPVVPLVPINEQASLPQPLVLDPPVQGKGEWINTSIYVFSPTSRCRRHPIHGQSSGGLARSDGRRLAGRLRVVVHDRLRSSRCSRLFRE